MMGDETKCLIDVNQNNLARIIGFVGVMDSKAKFMLTLVLALAGYLVAQLGPFLDAHRGWQGLTNWAPPFFVLLDLAAAACFGCFLYAALFVIRAIEPRTGQHTRKSSPLFFGTIADMALEDFKTAMKGITPSQVVDLLADQTYDNAKVVQQKTADVQRSIKFFCWGMVCFFAFAVGRPILLSLVGH